MSGEVIYRRQTSVEKVSLSGVTDNFESYNTGNLGGQGNWVDCLGNIQVYDDSGNQVATGTVDIENYVRRSESFTDDQYAEATVKTLSPSTDSLIGPAVRCSGTGSNAGCFCFHVNNIAGYVAYYIEDSWNVIEDVGGYANGTVLKLEIEGTTLRRYVNGSLIESYDVSTIITNNSRLASGTPGIQSWDGFVVCDDFEGGDL